MAVPSITGLTQKRNGDSFTWSWNKPGNLTYKTWANGKKVDATTPVHHYHYYILINGTKVASTTLASSARSFSYTPTYGNYYPYTGTKFERISFEIEPYYEYTIRHKDGSTDKQKKHSDGVKLVFYMHNQATPTQNVPLSLPAPTTGISSIGKYAATFTASHNITGQAQIHDMQYQTAYTNGVWVSSWVGTSATSFNADYTDGGIRWFRAYTRTRQGDSGWSDLQYVVHATPNQPGITGSSTAKSGSGTRVNFNWYADTPWNRPVTYFKAEYVVATPTGTSGNPPSTGWSTLVEAIDPGRRSYSDTIYEDIDEDEFLYIRLFSYNTDDWSRSSEPALVPYYGGYKLKDPTIDSLTQDDQTFRVTLKATNNSTVPGASLYAVFIDPSNKRTTLNNGNPITSGSAVTLQCPSWAGLSGFRIAVYAKANVRGMGVMSGETSEGGVVPPMPTNVSVVEEVNENGERCGRVRWNWAPSDWGGISSYIARVSWANSRSAWESTQAPDDAEVANLSDPSLLVAESDMELGMSWYFRVRFERGSVAGAWSTITPDTVLDLSSAPRTPSIALSERSVYREDMFYATWAYESTDGTPQVNAQIAEAIISGGTITYNMINDNLGVATTWSAIPEELEWTSGETHYIASRVLSNSGRWSDWSLPAGIYVTEIRQATIAETSLEIITYDDHEILSLTELPMTVTITGAGDSARTRLAIERAAAYRAERPDGDDRENPDRETVYLYEQIGEDEITIDLEDLVGRLDDGAQYRIVATVIDEYGKSSSTESDVFEVHWSHQAVMPEATVSIDEDRRTATITPTEPEEGYEEGDYAMIYRLSTDKPELIVDHAEFGTSYVDPYPAFGEYGGHRVVYVTKYGDYITEDRAYAWIDLHGEQGDILESDRSVIDFDGEQLELKYNLELGSSWSKDFKKTVYLGGSVIGDWNPSIERTGSLSGVLVTLDEQEEILQMRQLARYPGICHVRTPEGSSYSADIQVSEDRSYNTGGKIVSFSLDITEVEPETFEGVNYDDWTESEEEE